MARRPISESRKSKFRPPAPPPDEAEYEAMPHEGKVPARRKQERTVSPHLVIMIGMPHRPSRGKSKQNVEEE